MMILHDVMLRDDLIEEWQESIKIHKSQRYICIDSVVHYAEAG